MEEDEKMMLLAAAFAVMLPYQAAARGRVGVFVGPRFAPFGWYGGWYDPYFYGPYGYALYPTPPCRTPARSNWRPR